MTTQPSEADFYAADYEACSIGMKNASLSQVDCYRQALARRIEAEREAVPVAWMYYADDGQEATPPLKNRLTPNMMGWTERALYAAPPKEPTT